MLCSDYCLKCIVLWEDRGSVWVLPGSVSNLREIKNWSGSDLREEKNTRSGTDLTKITGPDLWEEKNPGFNTVETSRIRILPYFDLIKFTFHFSFAINWNFSTLKEKFNLRWFWNLGCSDWIQTYYDNRIRIRAWPSFENLIWIRPNHPGSDSQPLLQGQLHIIYFLLKEKDKNRCLLHY